MRASAAYKSVSDSWDSGIGASGRRAICFGRKSPSGTDEQLGHFSAFCQPASYIEWSGIAKEDSYSDAEDICSRVPTMCARMSAAC